MHYFFKSFFFLYSCEYIKQTKFIVIVCKNYKYHGPEEEVLHLKVMHLICCEDIEQNSKIQDSVVIDLRARGGGLQLSII